MLCPNCPTEVVVRSSVFDERFWVHLFAVLLPLLILAGVAALLYRVGQGAPPSATAPGERS